MMGLDMPPIPSKKEEEQNQENIHPPQKESSIT
jgi:hypothetical protein